VGCCAAQPRRAERTAEQDGRGRLDSVQRVDIIDVAGPGSDLYGIPDGLIGFWSRKTSSQGPRNDIFRDQKSIYYLGGSVLRRMVIPYLLLVAECRPEGLWVSECVRLGTTLAVQVD
jgi:hypothetical protein